MGFKRHFVHHHRGLHARQGQLPGAPVPPAQTETPPPTTFEPGPHPGGFTDTDTSVTPTPLPATSANPIPPVNTLSSTSSTSAPALPTSTSSTSSSSSSSSSSTSSTSTSSTASSTSATSTTPAVTLPPTPTQQSTSVTVQTVIGSGHSSISAGSAASATTSPTPAGAAQISTGAVIGLVVAGLVAVGGLIFAIWWFCRRRRDDDDVLPDLSSDELRRQSVAIPDGETSAMSRGFGRGGPRPPTMIQQKMAIHSPIAPRQFMGAAPGTQFDLPPQPSFAPGEFVSMGGPNRAPTMSPPPMTITPPIATQYFSPIGGQQSPIGSPVAVPAYESAYNAQGQLVSPQNSTNPRAFLTRQPSTNAHDLAPPDAHYVDLNRSSVTPFQEQQYVEISRRLNTTPPVPLATPGAAPTNQPVAEPKVVEPKPLEVGRVSPNQQDFGRPTPSPFADPEGSDEGQEILLPPIPAASRDRITSTPPMLPEIHIHQRAFSPVSYEYPLVPSTPTPRPSPSPLATSFSLPSPPVVAHFRPDHDKLNALHGLSTAGAGEPSSAALVVTQRARPQQEEFHSKQRPDTVYTVYEDDDAYGGM